MQENAVAGVVVVDRDRHRLRLFTTASAVDIMSPSLDRHDRVHRVAFHARTFIGLESFSGSLLRSSNCSSRVSKYFTQ